MSDTKTPGDKKVGGGKTLTLKPRTETGVVRQSFSHGRSKQVVVEKRGKRRIGDGPEPHAPEVAAKPAPAAPAAPSRPAPPAPPRNAGSGVVLRTLTEDERSARASALADAKLREVEERRQAEEEAQRRAVREAAERAEREAAEDLDCRHQRIGTPGVARRSQCLNCRKRRGQDEFRHVEGVDRDLPQHEHGEVHDQDDRKAAPAACPVSCHRLLLLLAANLPRVASLAGLEESFNQLVD